MVNSQHTPEERELILNTLAVEAERKIDWQKYAAHLMADYGITQTDVEEYIEKHGPLIKPKLLEMGSFAPTNQALRAALKFMREMKAAKNIPASEQTANMFRTWDKQENSLPGSSEPTLKFALAKNPVEKARKKFSRIVFEELTTLGLTFIVVYQIFPRLPDIIFRQSIADALEFTFYWAIFKYIIFPTFFLFLFAVTLISLWRLDKESRKIAIAKWWDRLKTFAEMKWLPPISSFLFTLCPIMFMNYQHPLVFRSESLKGLLLAGAVLWFLQMFLYFIFRKRS